MTSERTQSSRFDALDLVRSFAILGMLGSHLVGTEGGATQFERGITGFLAAIEPTVAALFCVVAGVSWSIQAERVGVTPRFRRYFAGRAVALGVLGVFFHVLFWSTDIMLPFALMMAASLIVLGKGPRATALALLLFVAITPVVERLVAPYAATDWLDNGLHVADYTVGWVTLRYLLVDGNYPLISWMAFPLMGMLFWRITRTRLGTLGWFVGSSGVAVVVYAGVLSTAPAAAVSSIASGWTPTSATFLLAAGSASLAVVSALLWWWGTGPMPRVLQPFVLFGRASLSHYVLHIVVAYSVLRLFYPDEDWGPGTGLWAFVAYLAIGVPLTVYWLRSHTHGPLEALLARTSPRPGRLPSSDRAMESWPSVKVVRNAGLASLQAARSFAPGDIVFPLAGRLVERPTRRTIQVAMYAHLDPVSELVSPWGWLNHGCDPNVAIDIPNRVVIARLPIGAGDELRFDYNSTEWKLAEPFVCNCGAPTCVGVAMGFAYLSLERQQVMVRDAAPHIRTLHAVRRRAADRELQPAAR